MMLIDKAGCGGSGRGTGKVIGSGKGGSGTDEQGRRGGTELLTSAPPCRRCRHPQGLVLLMLLPQVLYTLVAN